MKCEKCNSERITVISEYIETKEKDGIVLFGFLYSVCIVALLVAFGFLIAGLQKPKSIPLDQIVEIMTAIEISKITIPALFLTMILKRVAPFKHVTKTKVVCLECGNYWYLQDKDETNSKSNGETLKKEEIEELSEEELKKEPEEKPERELEEEPERERGSGFIKFVFIIAGLVLIGALIYGFASSCPSKKATPNIRLEETVSGVIVYVEAEDDYDEVKVEVEFYDTSGNLANTRTLTGRNYKKGNTYTLSISLSLSERLNYTSVRYRLKSYE